MIISAVILAAGNLAVWAAQNNLPWNTTVLGHIISLDEAGRRIVVVTVSRR